MSNCVLQSTGVIRDLGVLHDGKSLFDKHIKNVTDKGYKAFGCIIRVCHKHMKTMKIHYCAYFCSHLEFCSSSSSLVLVSIVQSTNTIERTQKQLIQQLGFKFKLPHIYYEKQCIQLHLLPLFCLRKGSDICLLLNIE